MFRLFDDISEGVLFEAVANTTEREVSGLLLADDFPVNVVYISGPKGISVGFVEREDSQCPQDVL